MIKKPKKVKDQLEDIRTELDNIYDTISLLSTSIVTLAKEVKASRKPTNKGGVTAATVDGAWELMFTRSEDKEEDFTGIVVEGL